MKTQRKRGPAGRIEIVGTKVRRPIFASREPFLQAVLKVLDNLREFLPLTQRQIHYNLLNDPPLMNASNPRSRYRNDIYSPRALSHLCTDAIISGRIPEGMIKDETRPITLWRTWSDAEAFVADQLEELLTGYTRDLQQSQPDYVELLVEKNSIAQIVEQVAAEYQIPMTSGRGYSSLPPVSISRTATRPPASVVWCC